MKYRQYVPGADDASVLELRAEVWGRDHPHASLAFLQWLLAQNLLGTGVVMEEAGRSLGFVGLVPRHVNIKGESQLAALCVDYMVHPQARSGVPSFRIMSIWADVARK